MIHTAITTSSLSEITRSFVIYTGGLFVLHFFCPFMRFYLYSTLNKISVLYFVSLIRFKVCKWLACVILLSANRPLVCSDLPLVQKVTYTPISYTTV